VRAVVIRVQIRDDDPGLLGLGVDEIAPVDVDVDMRQAGLERVLEEVDVAGFPCATADRTPELLLHLDAAGNVHAVASL
jgi:hypothetical protein